MRSPYPLTGKLGDISLDNHELMIVEGSYVDTEAQRLGEHITEGDLSYGDFNPYESADVAAGWHGGFGLWRYSDLDDQKDAHRYVLDAEDAEIGDSHIIMSGERSQESLPSATGPIIFMSEMRLNTGVTKFVAVAGGGVYTRDSSGVWTRVIVLATTATCAGIFGGALIVGYGAASVAQVTTNLTAMATIVDDLGASMYITQVTADHSAVFIAGDNAISGSGVDNAVWSSVSASVFPRSSRTTIVPPYVPVTGLAPGGGVAGVFYTWSGGLGMIDTAGAPRTLVPFDWPDPQNGTGLGWFIGKGDDQQRGPLVLHFRRDNDPYLYAPAGSSGPNGAGEATNIAPWANHALRPHLTYGVPTAWCGAGRYLWIALTNPGGGTFIVKYDMNTGVMRHYWSIGVQVCKAIAITGQFNDQPILFVGGGTGVVYSTNLPKGSNVLSVGSSFFGSLSTVYMTGADLNMPDEEKVEFSVRVSADNLAESVRYVQVYYALDEFPTTAGGWIVLGQATTSPVSEIPFTDPPIDHYIYLKAVVHNTDHTNTPIINAITIRRSLNPKLYRWWEFDAIVPAGEGQFADDLQNPYLLKQQLWLARIRGTPVLFRDLDGDVFQVRIMKLTCRLAKRAHNMPPQVILSVTLLQTQALVAISIPLVFTAPSSAGGSSWPLPIPVGTVGLYSSVLDSMGTVVNPTLSDVYPVWTVTGPAGFIQFINNENGRTWEWSGALGLGATMTIDFRPTKHTVVDQDLVDYSDGVDVSSEWWSLLAGSNSISVLVTGTSEQTQVSLTAYA